MQTSTPFSTVAALKEILRCATTDMSWAVILNPDSRNEESLTLFWAVDDLDEIASPDFVGIAMTASYD